ncbi:MAG: hypothetical protein E7315_04195 [Clostridiales bacterium]|nr:hypothetical protein [Clostridiales bacterium]
MIYTGFFFNTSVYIDCLILPSLAILAYKSTLDISLLYFIAFFIHEAGHLLAGRLLDIKIESFIIGPYGGVINIDSFFIEKKTHQIILYLSGILFNLITFAIFLPVGGLTQNIPLLTFSYINIVLVAVNIIPAYPWDGMNILYPIIEYICGRQKAASICTAISLSIGLLFFIAGTVYFFITGELPLLVIFISIVIVFSTFNDRSRSKNTEYSYAIKKYRYIKQASAELKIKNVAIKEHISIKKALKSSREGVLTIYHVYSSEKNSGLKFLGEISEPEILASYIETGANTTIGKLLNNKINERQQA